MNEVHNTTERSAKQEPEPKYFHPRLARPTIAAFLYGSQVILFLRQARRDADERGAKALTRLIEAQQAICRGLESIGVLR